MVWNQVHDLGGAGVEVDGGAAHEKRKFKYFVLQADGNEVLLDTKQLYAKAVRKKWRKVAGLPWRVVSCTVQLNLEENGSKPERWQRVKLLFVRGLDDDDNDPSKKNSVSVH